MGAIKDLDDIAQGVAEVTLTLMEDTVHWKLEDFPLDGDEYESLVKYVMALAIDKMTKEI